MGRVDDLYEEEFGPDKLAVQKALWKAYYTCCAEPKGGPHHRACRKYVDDEQPVVIPGQIGLLSDAL